MSDVNSGYSSHKGLFHRYGVMREVEVKRVKKKKMDGEFISEGGEVFIKLFAVDKISLIVFLFLNHPLLLLR